MGRLERKKKFIRALAEFLGGTNQVRMSCALAVGEFGGEIFKVAKLWQTMRGESFLNGYPTIEEAEASLEEFLG